MKGGRGFNQFLRHYHERQLVSVCRHKTHYKL